MASYNEFLVDKTFKSDALQVALNVLISRCHARESNVVHHLVALSFACPTFDALGFLTDVPIDATTNATIRVHPIRIKLWGLLLKFIQAPSQENVASLVLPFVEITITKQQHASSCAASPTPLDLASIAALASPTNPIWSQALPLIHRFGSVGRFVHLVDIFMTNISILVRDTNHQPMFSVTVGTTIDRSSVHATMLLDPDKHHVVVSLNVCHHLPMTMYIPSAHMNVDVQQVALQVTVPISKSPSDARLPLPSSVSISGHSLHVSVKLLAPQPPLDATIPSPPVSLPTVSQTHTTAANNNNNEAMINLIALLPSVVSFSWHSAKVIFEHPSSPSQCSVELLQIALVSPKHAAVAVDVHGLSAQVVPRQASPPLQLLQLGPMTGSVDVTRPHVSSLALNVSAELKRVHVVLGDVLEPWVSLVTNLQVALPPPPPHMSIISSVQLHGKVTNVSVLLCPRTALDLDDPSHLCPPLEILVDDVYVSALPPHLVGVRSRAELRLTRVGIRLESSIAPSVTLDYMRMLFYPIASFLHGKTDVAADVEMEGEWLDVHYTPQLLHALGGVARLVLFTCQTPLAQVFATPKPTADDNVIRPRRSGVDMFKREPVYPRVKFQGLVKRIVASFPVALPSTPPSTEQVSVDSLTIETDAATSRFRMHMDQIHVSTQGPKKCKPYMVVGHFAVEEAPVGGTSVVDLHGQDVAVTWDVLTQVRVAKAVQDVTTAVYRMLFQIFHGYTMHVAPPHSKFKVWGVHVGVNPAMDDAAAYIAMRAHLSNAISASGDKLHRVAIRNVSVSVPALEITVTVDEFGGDDVPDLWTFGSIQVTWRHQPKLVSMANVSVRRTVAGRLDYVFGDFEAILRQRQKVLAASDDGHGASSVEEDDETLCVCICDLHVEIPYGSWSDLVTLSTQMQTLAATLTTTWHDTMSEFWRPQHPLFFRYFAKLHRPSSRPKIELDMRQLDVEWVDDPMETWLAHMAPLWMDTLAEQEGWRQVVLHDHRTSHLHDNTTMTNEEAGFESKQIEVLATFAKAYVTRVQETRKQQQTYTHNKTNSNMARLRVSVCRLHGWVLPLVDPVRLIRKMKELDNDTLSLLQLPRCVRPCFDLLVGVSMHVHVESIQVHVRGGGGSSPSQASPPIVKVPNVELQGDVVVAQPTSTPAFHVTNPVDIAAFSHLQVVTSRIPLKCFLDLNVGVTGTTVAYNPVLNSSMVGLALDAQQCLFAYILPSLEVETWAYWDIVRRLVHGKYSVTCRDTTVQLMARQNVAEGVQLTLHKVQVAYTNKGTVDIHLDKVQCKLEPHGGAVDTFVDIPAVALAVDWTWIHQDDDDTVSSLHYIYPMKFTYLENANQVQVHVHNPHIMHHSPSRLSMGVRCIVGTNDRKDTTSVVVYGSTVARLLELGQSYMEMCAIATVTSRQRRCGNPRRPLVPSLSDLQHHIHRVVLRSVQVEHGVDVALYHSDQSPVGVRVHINDIFASLAMTCGAIRSLADCFQHHMVVATNPKKATWAIHDVVANVQEIQIRVCTVKSGSRGDACVTLHQSYAVMEPSKLMPPWEDKAKAIVERFHAAAVLVDASTGGDGPQVRDVASPPPSSETKSILEHFAIQDDVHLLLKQRSPASSAAAVVVASTPSKEKCQTPRRLSASRLPPPPPSTASLPLGDGHDSSPELGCLCYVLVHQPRVHMTLDTIDAVVEMALEWRAFVQEYMPPSDIPISVIHQVEAAVATPVADTCDDVSGDLTSHLEHMLHPAAQPKVRVSSTNDFLLHSKICGDVDDVRLPITTDIIAIQTLLRINVVDFQLAVQDSAHKGSILVAIPSGCVEPAVDLEHHTEHVDVSVCGVFVFTSSLEVDMTSNMHHTWLKVERSMISQSSTMLWKQVLHASAIECGISHDVVPNVHQVSVHVANIDAILDVESKQTLLDMGTLLSTRIQDKLESHTKPAANSVVIESGASIPPSTHPPLNTEDDDGPLSSTPDIVAMLPQLWRQRRTLQWTIATLRYVESCRFGVLASAVPDVDTAALRPLPWRLLSSVQSPPPSRPSAASARLTALAHDVRVLNAELAFAIREYYKHKQVHPTVDLHFELDEASLLVKGPTFDLLRLQLQQVEGTVARFQDQSGTLSIQLHTMFAANLMPQTPLPDLLVPVDRNQQAKDDFVDAGTRVGGVVRVDAEMAAPVGGQLVVQHFEINVLPLQVCITYELVLQLVAFMSTAQSPHIHKQEEMVRSQFLVYSAKTSNKKAARVSNTSEDVANLLRGDDGEPPRPPPPTTPTNNSSSYNLVTFKHIRLGTILVLLTYKSGKATPTTPQHLEEMRGFELKLHSLVYTDKTCTLSELVLRVRRDILLDVLSQVGRNFNNIGIFLKERLDISRWAGFDMNNPLKSLSMSSGAADVPPSAVHKKPSQVVFSLELKPDKSAKLNPIKKAKSRFGFLKLKKKTSKATEVSAAEVYAKSGGGDEDDE
ncbi:hypothetical protein DYB35_006187 [Aphanomyces astaci]|uniref:FMP27 C-terminal domain-containing protein n=1 Tax=Aphanomyces astaci TaxID=112090 RepID=A0A3R7BNY9_APHAT|nr:hypothetical protein DYB35_006187 [Aphanomyces astaci]